ncbi:MAG: REP-associated tyrosine transposase [Pyrinomonadaceae bacterium]
MRRRIEGYVDSGYGSCFLRDRRVAAIVRDTLLFHHNTKYILHAWVIMPNHAHILAQPLKGVHLPKLVHSIKSYSAQKANEVLSRTGKFWQHDFFDRYIRSTRHFSAVLRYIHNNPVKAGLCTRPEEWEFSSACNASGVGEQGCSPPQLINRL